MKHMLPYDTALERAAMSAATQEIREKKGRQEAQGQSRPAPVRGSPVKTKPTRKSSTKSKAGSETGSAPASQTACPHHATSLLLCCCRIIKGRRPGTVGVNKVDGIVLKRKAA